MIKVVVIDERKGAMRSDGSNVEAGTIGNLVDIDEAKIVVRIGQDGIWFSKGQEKALLLTVKSEADLSAEKAKSHREARLERSDASTPSATTNERLARSLGQQLRKGTDG